MTNHTLKIQKGQLNRNEKYTLKRHLKRNGGSIKESGILVDIFVILIILLNKFFYNNVILLALLKKLRIFVIFVILLLPFFLINILVKKQGRKYNINSNLFE